MRISDWSSDVCSSDLAGRFALRRCLLVEERTQVVRAARMAQLAQRLGLDLANALAGDVELLADFFERVVGVHVDAEAHPQPLGLTRGQRCADLVRGLGPRMRGDRTRGA